MAINDFHKEIREQLQRQQDRQLHELEIQQDQDFQTKLQTQAFEFEKEQTDRFIQSYEATNKKLEDINTSLREQLEQTRLEANAAKRDSRWATAFSIISILVAIASVLVSALT